MRTSAAGNSGTCVRTPRTASRPARGLRGFTLLELLVVVAIIAVASVGVGFALGDTGRHALEREGERLAALLESARAQSRASGNAVRWRAEPGGFRFEGLTGEPLPRHWLQAQTRVLTPAPLWLGPEPLIGPQEVLIVNPELPGQTVRVASDGLRPFAAHALR